MFFMFVSSSFPNLFMTMGYCTEMSKMLLYVFSSENYSYTLSSSVKVNETLRVLAVLFQQNCS